MLAPPARVIALVAAVAAACSAADDLASDLIDAEHADFPAGKADGAIDAASREAAGILALVNDPQVTLTTLDIDAALHATAAANIIAARPFADLAALDAVPYVGPVALERLLAFATANGYLPDDVLQLPLELHWTRNSAEHHAAFVMAYRQATAQIDALAASGRLPAGGWAVALDADETVLDNTLYQKERAALGLGYSWSSWQAWVARREAAPLPGAVAFMSRVKALGGTIAVVTNRQESVCDHTRANLSAEAIPFDVVLCRTGVKDKQPRWDMVEDGTAAQGLAPAEIVMWVGDNIHDFPGLQQQIRFENSDAFADFGTRFIVLPNPMYGSWTGNHHD